jgi:hypothetical protein
VKASECEGRLQKQRGESGTEPMKGEKYLRFDVIQRSITFAALAAHSNYSIMPNKSPSKSSTKIMGSFSNVMLHKVDSRDVTRP